MFKSLFTGFLTAWGLLCGCPIPDNSCEDCSLFKFKIEKVGQLPEEITESSGLVFTDGNFFTHGDSGNEATLYGFRYPFEEAIVEINNDVWINKDWEDLAHEDKRKIFIGDFGNNQNNRKDLKVISYNYSSQETNWISYSYGDQNEFPPNKFKEQNFDCEAMIWHDEKLYLFSKNKRSKFTKVYQLVEHQSDQTIYPYDSIKLWNTPITGADISPDQKEIVLLSYGKVLFFFADRDNNGNLQMTPKSCKKFRRSGQAEAVTYIDNEHLLITNEKGKVFLLYRKYKKQFTGNNQITTETILKQISN